MWSRRFRSNALWWARFSAWNLFSIEKKQNKFSIAQSIFPNAHNLSTKFKFQSLKKINSKCKHKLEANKQPIVQYFIFDRINTVRCIIVAMALRSIFTIFFSLQWPWLYVSNYFVRNCSVFFNLPDLNIVRQMIAIDFAHRNQCRPSI